MACPQLRPGEHARDDPEPDQLADGLAAEGEVDLCPQGRERVRGLRVNADLTQRNRLLPGPELERLRARPHDRQAQVGAQVQQAERGANGVAFGNGRIYGATEADAFALDAQTGTLLWSRKLTRNNREGIDMTPQVYDNKVLFSTVPGNGVSSFYQGGALGVVWALDAATGKPKWTFNTIQDGAKLFGNPKVNSGGGLWYPPSVDSHGRVFISVANPAPLYGTKKFPNVSSRPGADLYTNSVVALDGQTGRRLWFQQALPHDLRDYDLMIPAILTTLPVGGVDTEVVLVAGKMGKAFAYRADNGQRLWMTSVGRHLNDTGPLTKKVETVFPGDFGGVETPMAFAG